MFAMATRALRCTIAAAILAGSAGCGSEDAGPADHDHADDHHVLHVRWLHGKGIGTLATPTRPYDPAGLWEAIRELFPDQHERGRHPWLLVAYELRPQVAGNLALELTDHGEGRGVAGEGVPMLQERWPLEAGTRRILLLATSATPPAGSRRSTFRAVLLDQEGDAAEGAGRVGRVEQDVAVALPPVPETAPPGRWHAIGTADVMVDTLMGYRERFEQPVQLLAWAPEPSGPVTHEGRHDVPQVQGREVVKGQYEHPVAELVVRFP